MPQVADELRYFPDSSGIDVMAPSGISARQTRDIYREPALLHPVVKRPVAVNDVDRECLQRCVPDDLEATMNDVGHVRQQRAGRKHDRILAWLLHHGPLD